MSELELRIDGITGAGNVHIAEELISARLRGLGRDSDAVAQLLAAHPGVAGQPLDEDPVLLYLQHELDPSEQVLMFIECDALRVSFIVRNPDAVTWTHASTPLPAPLVAFCSRLDDGEFPHLKEVR